jgi:hypothetical protein
MCSHNSMYWYYRVCRCASPVRRYVMKVYRGVLLVFCCLLAVAISGRRLRR